MNRNLRELLVALGLALVLVGCSRAPAPPTGEANAKPALPPEPVVNHSPSDAQPGQKIEHGELILDANEATRQLNAQHHSYKVLQTRRVPGPFQRPGPPMSNGASSHCVCMTRTQVGVAANAS